MRLIAILLLLLYLPLLNAANTLAGHPSPYLAMHAEDPVEWQAWGPEVLERARRENKLLFVSVGYFACYWCHVMQKESFRDPAVAALLNRYFIAVKVDRELQPALDEWLMGFVERTEGRGGWPLNVFITPAGNPLVGTVYQPQPTFKRLLEGLQGRWVSEHQSLARMAETAARAMQAEASEAQEPMPEDGAAELQQRFLQQLDDHWDEFEGGFGNQSKFPSVPQLRTILHANAKATDSALEAFLHLTLKQMAAAGLRDQVGGGFFRYTVDPGWQIPHFEKMLYDNAQLADLYLEAAVLLEEPYYREVGLDTLNFVLREMAGDGAYIASLSAVDELGEEGGAYFWRKEMQRLLSADEWQLLKRYWGVDLSGAAEQLPRQTVMLTVAAISLGLSERQAQQRLMSARSKLIKHRRLEQFPRDVKQIAEWNGLLLTALSRAVMVSDRKEYRAAAEGLAEFLATRQWDGQQLFRMASRQQRVGRAVLGDYAAVAEGLASWAKVTHSERYLKLAERVLRRAWRDFMTEQGWQLQAEALVPFGVAEQVVSDGPIGSPSSRLLKVTLQVAKRLKSRALLQRAEQALGKGYGEMKGSPFWYASQIDLLANYRSD
ncbi:hypothetical protein BOW53_05355 [Solemya pervernicosa gill symbiont]|uniref:Spermatogenesis-associated protein 20-like TRX domain-containing protein n=2 Tax=Gammaproteobacteria incertae sedis TaxID=118884 RepID=A0A1T2L768_9GAMM|nr:DUF255 domain-containing protein [Candidatus Reidiella endopervernicosa]OOZ40958.1 hypothetical protein BOW53_05355 [Solemya pervernicosa gill symbiont]QKQ25006.1 thioredoxin domain-containing protein [Candidatus Reidiella endopervernicosa]